jgi:hypothetical protein
MLDVAEIVERLHLTIGPGVEAPIEPTVLRVSASILVEQALDGVPVTPALFVLPGIEGVENAADPWQPRHVVREELTIIAVVRNVSDPRGEAAAADLLTVSEAIKATLLGWRPTNRGPLVFVSAQPVGFDDQFLVWSETFATRRSLVPQQA